MKLKRPEFVKKFENMNKQDINKRVAESWKIISDEEKKVYNIMSYFDKVRYYKEKLNDKDDNNIKPPVNYNSFINATSLEEQYAVVEDYINQKNKAKTIRAREPYVLFLIEQSKILQKQYPGINFTEISKIISELWRKMNEREKEKYKKMSQKEKLILNNVKYL